MAVEFCAERNPSKEMIAEAEHLTPTNPFYTFSYIEAKRVLGFQPWILFLRKDGKNLSACTAFMKSGYLNRTLEITSLPNLSDMDVFWEGLKMFCLKRGISSLEVNTFGSNTASIPSLAGEVERTIRCEHVIDLRNQNLWSRLHKNHKYSVKHAQKLGVQIRRVSDPQACHHHAGLIEASMVRRRERGEAVPTDIPIQTYLAMTGSGAGEIFQAVLGSKVLSSDLVLKAERGAYLHSSGTSLEGRTCDAAPFLIYEIAKMLQIQGMEVFNMGGATQRSPGLYQFKAHFGATQVSLEAAQFYLHSKVKKKLATAVSLLRDEPFRFLKSLAGQLEQSLVYAADPRKLPSPEHLEGAIFQKLTDEVLESLASQRDEMVPYRERFHQQGFNNAYAVFRNGRLAHISWLLTADNEAVLPDRVLKLRTDEAEITQSLTLPEFRGQGIYPFAILSLCQLAAERGIHRIFMGRSINNTASQRGIVKAGLMPVGKVVRWGIPYLPGHPKFTYRGYRWTSRGSR